jgi:hypothetical protein
MQEICSMQCIHTKCILTFLVSTYEIYICVLLITFYGKGYLI